MALTSGTRVKYNGVWIENCLTREFSQAPVRDPSNSDTWYWLYSITVEGTINIEALNAVSAGGGKIEHIATGTAVVALGGTDVSGMPLATAAVHVLDLLKRDRGEFQYIQEGTLMVSAGVLTDCNNGPKVRDVKLIRISPAVYFVSFSIDVALAVCDLNFPTAVPQVLGNRWSCADDIDENFITTRTWRGVLRVSTPVTNPNSLRGLVVPVRQKGWRRIGMRFVVEQSGLELGYEVQDRLMAGEAAPSPAYKMNYTHSNGFSMLGAKGASDFNITLSGGRGSDKRDMLKRAYQIITHKMNFNLVETLRPSGGRIEQLVIRDISSEHGNEIQAFCQVVYTRHPEESIAGSLLDKWGLPIASFNIDADLPADQRYDPDQPQTRGPYAAGGIVGAFIAYQQTPCVDSHSISSGVETPNQQTTDPASNDEPPATSVQVYEGDPQNLIAPPATNESHQQFPYTYVRMESRYKSGSNRLFLPLAYASDVDETHIALAVSPASTYRHIKYEAERTGDWPEVWGPQTFVAAGVKHTLLDHDFTPRPPEKTIDGQTLYVIDATYVYGLGRALGPADKWAIGSLPWDTQSTDDCKFDGAKFISPTDPIKGIGIDQAES